MLDFEKELKNFEPVMMLEEINEDEAQADSNDVMQLLQYLFTTSAQEIGGRK